MENDYNNKRTITNPDKTKTRVIKMRFVSVSVLLFGPLALAARRQWQEFAMSFLISLVLLLTLPFPISLLPLFGSWLVFATNADERLLKALTKKGWVNKYDTLFK